MKSYEINAKVRDEQPTVVADATLSVGEIGPWLGKAYHTIVDLLASRGVEPAGPAFARYHMLGGGLFTVAAGIPVSSAIEVSGDLRASSLPGGPVAVTVHVGPYDQMGRAYEALAEWVRDHGGELNGDPWEVYLTDPMNEPDPATWRTEIVQPYRPR